MSQEALTKLLDRFINEPGFRESFSASPHETVVSHGIDLTPEEEDALKRMDWSGSDEELGQRVSKSPLLGKMTGASPSNCGYV